MPDQQKEMLKSWNFFVVGAEFFRFSDWLHFWQNQERYIVVFHLFCELLVVEISGLPVHLIIYNSH